MKQAQALAENAATRLLHGVRLMGRLLVQLLHLGSQHHQPAREVKKRGRAGPSGGGTVAEPSSINGRSLNHRNPTCECGSIA